jgi:hypothetical protein
MPVCFKALHRSGKFFDSLWSVVAAGAPPPTGLIDARVVSKHCLLRSFDAFAYFEGSGSPLNALALETHQLLSILKQPGRGAEREGIPSAPSRASGQMLNKGNYNGVLDAERLMTLNPGGVRPHE